MDKNREDEIVGSLYGTEYFGGSGRPSGGGTPGGSGSTDGGFWIKLVLILLAIIAFAAYSKAQDKKREKAYRQMKYEHLYKGYSDEDWQRSKYNRDGSLKSNYNNSSNSSTTTKKSSDTTRKSTTYKKPATESSDNFNVKDYRNPEDFYYDNYDDFFDFEEAEDYYYDNGGF